ncbi:hypothetical protein J7T55_010803 [Diaporthe amygdali]|uniref:uncharacterized protein n=1 Tax=Phomopsis amygdali TaxID=1214568 RepID=UPI0022FF2E1D|nr:uncharacterized protein J7T55_010803 [Diaporthe amygdali]KAJ0114414.1 hypothetical protein J7T55_010803 [Diaporthe amygdali]
MAPKLSKGLRYLFTICLLPRRFPQPVTDYPSRATPESTARICRCQSCRWFPFHVRQLELDGVSHTKRYPREGFNVVSASFSLRAHQWEGAIPSQAPLQNLASFSNTVCIARRSHQWEGATPGRVWPPTSSLFSNSVHLMPRSHQWEGIIPSQAWSPVSALFSSTARLTPRSHQWEGAQDLEEVCRSEVASRSAEDTLSIHKRQGDHKPNQLPLVVPLVPTTFSPFINRPHRRRGNAGAMPRSGYDTTNMRVASNPRSAAFAGASGNSKNEKPGRGGKPGDGKSGEDSGKGGGGDEGSEKTTEQKPDQGKKDGESMTEEVIKNIDQVRIPLAGRGWTFWI